MRAKASLLLFAPALLGTACGRPAPEAGPFAAEAPSVLLVTLDTTRADRLGCYGYQDARTPNLDGLARGGVRFERAYSHVPLTLPSHATLMSGIHPSGTGLHVNFQGAINRDVPLLAEMFAASGYRTGAFIAAWVLNGEFGLDRGFETYDDLEEVTSELGVQVERRADAITDAALAWLSAAPEERFFAWLHYFDAHDPYEPPAEFEDAATPYDGELAFVDAQLGRILTWLEEHDRLASTLVVVTGDHGEGLGEHGESTHGLFLYDSTMHVPLIVSLPGDLAPRTVAGPVGLVDLHPTIVELCGGESSSLVEGRSLVGALRGNPRAAGPILAESEYSLRSFGWAPLSSLHMGSKKLIEAPRPEVFDTDIDPGELTDLSATSPSVLLALRGELASFRAGLAQREPEGIALDERSSSNLAALGYVEGANELATEDLEDLRDPKDVRHVYSGTMRAKALHDQGKHQEVVDLLAPLLVDSPESDEVWSLMAASQLALGHHAEAREAYEKSLRVRPDVPGRLTALAEALIGLEELEEAHEVLVRAEAVAGDDAQIQSRLGLVLARQGHLTEAEAHFRKQAKLAPESANAPVNLANCLFAQSRFDEGLESLAEALRLDARCQPAWVARLQVLLNRGRVEEARTATRECLEALGDNPQFVQGLLAMARGVGDPQLIELVEAHLSKQ